MRVVYLTRRETFCAAHRLDAKGLSLERNQALFGACHRENGHGHNYTVEVTLRGPVDPQTGIVFNLADLKKLLQEQIQDRLDHKNLNLDVPEFKDLNPSAENIAIVIWNSLVSHLPNGLLYEVKLYETENNSVVYRGESLNTASL